MNLYDRKIHKLTLNNAKNPTSVTTTASFSLPAPPLRSSLGGGYAVTYAGDNTQFYDGTKGRLRPFALKYYRGKLYVGAVTTGEGVGAVSTTDNNSGNPEYTDLWAYVFEFDPVTNTWTPAPVLQFPLNFNRGVDGDGYDETFELWKNTGMTTGFTWSGAANIRMFYAQAMLTDIEFDPNDGSMILGLRDRIGDQIGHFQNKMDNTAGEVGTALGEILRAYRTSSCSFQLETNGKEGASSPNAATTGAGNGQGPGGGEFYYQDNVYDASDGNPNATFHNNTTEGSLALLPGTGNVMVTSMDPADVWQQGVDWFSNTNGTNTRNHSMEVANAGNNSTGYSGKGSGMGDIELICYYAIEIGNRIWNDANGNGIQDAGEAGISAVALELFLDANNDGVPDGAAIGSVTTDANGNFFFTNAPGTDATGIDYAVSIETNQNYIIRVAASDWTGGAGTGDLLNYRLTGTDITGNGAVDFSDNDAVMTGGGSTVPQIRFTTGALGQGNHNLDFGFKQLGGIGDKVWLDNGTGGGTANDGLQNGGEVGVAGITVELFLNGTRTASTVTDAYGNYFFDNLATGGGNIYTVRVTPPANYSFSVQTNASADLGNDAIGSDINPLTGVSYNVTLTAGEVERDIDAALIFNTVTALPSIGDKVWFDNGQGGGTANDGIQNGTEPGVAGITVTLYRDINTDGDVADPTEIIATTVTDANGNYLFTNLLAAANYQVGFSLPPTFIFSAKDAGGNDNTDSDVNTGGANFGKTDFFTLAASDILTIDAGINNSAAATTASIGDRVWNDIDQDGIQDADEPGIQGVTVGLYQSNVLIATVFTDAFGNFQFTNLAPGSGYEVRVTSPAGYTITTQDVSGNTQNDFDSDINGTGSTGQFNLVAGQRKDVDAGLYNSTAGLNSIGNFVWNDLDGDGVQDAGEPGVAGVSVIIRTSTGAQVDNPSRTGTQDYVVTTDKNGSYRFADLANGNYVLIFSNLPNGYSFTTATGAGDNANNSNSDVTAASGTTAVYNLTGGEYDGTVDAGLVKGISAGGPSLGSKVWYDLNANGIQDAGELGVSGVTVTLNSPGIDGIVGNGDDVTGIATLSTNALGEYLFTSGNVAGGLIAGLPYYITYSTLPSGYVFSTADQGTNDNADSDAGATGVTGIYILGPTEENLTVDAGINNPSATLGSISNLVYNDADGDGVQDAGEPGVPGITVRIYNDGVDGIAGNVDDVLIAVTTTDVNGNYLFDGLAADNYTLYFSNYPAGFVSTGKDQGGNDALDSDPNGTGKTDAVVLAAGQDKTDVDFGIRSTTTAVLGNSVWFDNDNDGVQDAGEPGIPGVTVILYNQGTGLPVASMITDANGSYLFTNIIPGTYFVEFSNIPTGTTFTQQNTAGDNGDNTNSDANPANGRTGNIVLTAGEVDLTIDAGVRRQTTASVGNNVWYDTNGNGIKDAGESPVGGITVSLVSGGVTIATAVTGDDGTYLFTNVTPGTYTMQFGNLPAGAAYTTQNSGGAGNDNNSNPNGAGLTLSFTVAAGGSDISIDAGLIGTPLPADGLILAAALNGNQVSLNWKTISENNTDRFEIERSTNGISFIKVGADISAAGSSAFEKQYNQKDDIAAVQHNGTLYYRVKLYDQNGSYKYSNVAAVRVKSTGIKVWPNPFTELLQVSITAQNAGKVELRISDAAGRIVLTQQQKVSVGVNQLIVPGLSGLVKGTYIVEVINPDANNRVAFKLTKE